MPEAEAVLWREAAALLYAARRDIQPLSALPGGLRPATARDAYAIQAALFEQSGAHLAGFKIGCSSQAAQDYLATDGPFYGCMSHQSVHESPAELSARRFNFRLMEPEFAFRLGADLPARSQAYGRDEVAGAVASLHPAFEVVTSAFGEAWTGAGALSLTADNGVHGAFILGPGRQDWRGLDLAAHRVTLHRNGKEEGEGVGANALGHPLAALAWLAGQGVLRGRGLKAGDLVTTGVVTPFIYVEAGDEVRADFGELGQVELRFTP
ncbi:MAG: fumarylacetoacetate hydrolase family protein [Kiloniellales bacterium]|jgi:2-keto-4-pentenoate hydratase